MKKLSTVSLLFLLAFRNLIRQKRRNFLLAFAMAFGFTILIVTSSFSTGISDLFLNKYMMMASGHLELSITERAGVKTEIIRDRERYHKFLQDHIKGIKYIRESVSTWARVIGIGKAEGLNISGVDKVELENRRASYQVIAGSLDDFLASSDGVMLYEKKAKALNVKVGDILQAKFNTIHGQSQATKYTVKCILKGGNLFEELTLLVSMKKLKEDMGLDSFESKKLQVILENPKTAASSADKLHALLKPRLAVIQTLPDEKGENILLLCPKTNCLDLFEMVSGQYRANKPGEVIVSQELAKTHALKIGDNLPLTYETKYQGTRTLNLTIAGVFISDQFKGNIALLTRPTHFKNYYDHLPKEFDLSTSKWQSLFTNGLLKDALEKEWQLLRRSPTAEDLMIKFAELNKYKWQGQALDIRTMWETGGQILQLEQGLNFLVLIALMIILGIIVIGIINTLTLSIRERGQEIGTMRSIGMFRGDILVLFILEYVQLAFFAGLTGIGASLVLMKLLAWPEIEATSTMSMFLYDGHLYFLKNPQAVMFFFFVLVMVTAMAAFWPSYKASRMKPAEALRKYE